MGKKRHQHLMPALVADCLHALSFKSREHPEMVYGDISMQGMLQIMFTELWPFGFS